MRITAIRPTKHGNVAVEADGAFLCAVQPDAWVASGLSVGDALDEAALAALQSRSEFAAARKKALALLSARCYPRRILIERLMRTVSAEAAEAAADRMEELGLLNDADYALRYAQELAENRSYAARRIRLELSKKGLDRAAIEDALAALEDRDDTAAAVALLERRYRVLSTPVEIRRAAALLERCDYSGDVIRTAIHAVRRLGEDIPDETL